MSSPSSPGRSPCLATVRPILVCFAVLVLPSLIAAQEPPLSGEVIFRQKCAACHGAQGEGTAAEYPQPLAGDLAPAQLTAFIAKSMPPGEREKCTPEEAEKVSAYVFSSFYSREAQARAQPPRIALSRLTARQYRNAVADLLASFRGEARWDAERGLKGDYNTVDDKGNGKQALSRVDPQIRFDFGTSSPDAEKINPREFSVTWRGSVFAPETGEYEFVVRTDQSVRLWVNHRVQPLIDHWVKSGNDTEFRGTIRLLGGRAYPLLFVFTKAGQGVMKTPEQKAKEPIAPASVSLNWIRPGRVEEVVPQRYLSPRQVPETLVVSTRFPPDDRSTGFERGSAISREWDQATTNAAIEIADDVRNRLGDLTGGATPEKPDYAEQLRNFCRQFAERAFRRPLTPEQQSLFVDRQFNNQPDLHAAVERMVMLTVKSPRFLYIGPQGDGADPYGVASRLAFTLWDSPPDAVLLAAAANGQLANPEQVAQHASRMTADPRFAHKLREFLWQWMKLDQVHELNKDHAQFPDFNPAVASDLRTSLELFLDEVLASEQADFRQLLLADALYLNGRLGKFYGVDLPADAPFQRVAFDATQRAGVLSHPYLMSVFADAATTSPIRRGVFIARGVLGRTLQPPPDAFAPLAASLHPSLTTRERVQLQTEPKACQACHALINPLGFTLENFDALGRLRREENAKPIDATGSYETRSGDVVRFEGVRALAEYLANSPETHHAFVEKLFHYSVQQPIRAFAPGTLARLREPFVQRQFNIRQLLVEIAAVSAAAPRAETTARVTPPPSKP